MVQNLIALQEICQHYYYKGFSPLADCSIQLKKIMVSQGKPDVMQCTFASLLNNNYYFQLTNYNYHDRGAYKKFSAGRCFP